MSARQIWDKSQKTLRESMTELSYTTWVAPLTPVCMDKDTLVMQTNSDITKKTLTGLFGEVVSNAVNRANSSNYKLLFISPEEREEYRSFDEDMALSDFSLNPNYTFDNFVIGNSNNFAQAAAKAVAENPAVAYNPLFIYGGVGLGKTHLMHAIGNRILERNSSCNIVYVAGETFTNEMIESISNNTTPQFRSKYRTADVLMVDDIQFIGGRVSTQEEFFNTFNVLHTARKQIILSSDKPPREITTLEDRLRSRFEGGLITDIQPPDIDTRIAILKKKVETENVRVDDEVLAIIAEKVNSNIRQLEGALTRLTAYAKFTGKPVDKALADEVLKDVIPGYENKEVSIEYVQQIVAEFYNVTVEDLKSQRRTADITFPRQVAMYLCEKYTHMSLKTIGRYFGNRDHSTVINARDKIDGEMKVNAQLKGVINDLSDRLKQ